MTEAHEETALGGAHLWEVRVPGVRPALPCDSEGSGTVRVRTSGRDLCKRKGLAVSTSANPSSFMVAGARSGPSAETVLGFRLRGASLKFRTFYLISCSLPHPTTMAQDDVSPQNDTEQARR